MDHRNEKTKKEQWFSKEYREDPGNSVDLTQAYFDGEITAKEYYKKVRERKGYVTDAELIVMMVRYRLEGLIDRIQNLFVRK